MAEKTYLTPAEQLRMIQGLLAEAKSDFDALDSQETAIINNELAERKKRQVEQDTAAEDAVRKQLKSV